MLFRYLLKVIPLLVLFPVFCFIHGAGYADVGDGIIVYGASASGATPQTRDYTASSTTFSEPTGLPDTIPAQETIINRVIIKANPIANEYVCGVMTSGTAPYRLTIYTWENGTWVQNWYDDTLPGAAYQSFDIAYENDSGNCMVVYSNGASAAGNELSYRRRIDGVWDGSSSPINSTLTTGVVEWVQMASRPNSDEIALAFCDANDDLSAFVWFNDGTNYTWQAQPSAALSTALGTFDSPKFDVAYEQLSGKVMIVHCYGTTAGIQYSTKPTGSSTWTTTTDTAFLDIADFIDLAPEPGTNYIAFASIASAVKDLQLGIWNGSAWTRANNWDTTTAAMEAYYSPVACGWIGTATRKAIFFYADSKAGSIQYFSWVKDAASPEQAADSPVDISQTPPFANVVKQNIRVKQDPAFDTNGRVRVIFVDGGSDLWTFFWDGASGVFSELEATTTVAVPMCADAAFTSIDPTFAELIDFQAKPIANGIELNWQTSSELQTKGYRIWRTSPSPFPSPSRGEGRERETEITKDLIKSRGSLLFGASYSYLDTTALPNEDYWYYLEEIEKSGRTNFYGPIPVGAIHELPLLQAHLRRDGQWEVDGKVIERSINDPKPARMTRSGGGRCLPDEQPPQSPFVKGDNAEGRQRGLSSLTKSIKALQSGAADLKIAVNEEGIYEITGNDLQQAGWISGINPDQISLFNQGAEVPIRVISAPYFAIQFYAKPPPPNKYTDTNIYYLKINSGQTRRIDEIPSITGTVNQYYWETLRVEKNEAYWPEFKQENHWFSADELFAPTTKDISFNINHIVTTSTDPAQLRVSLQGASTLNGMDPGHQKANIYINSQLLGTAEWNNDTAYLFTNPVALAFLNEGDNTLTIELPDETQTNQQCVLIDYVEIIYPRGFVARQNQISFTAPLTGIQHYEISGFSTEDIKVFAVHPNQPSEIDYITNVSIISESSQARVSFGYNVISEIRYSVLSSGLMNNPLSITPIDPIDLKNTSNQADYIIITPNEFVDALSPLVTQRTKNGLKVKVIPVEDIYDEFNYGLFSPVAIRDFLKWTYKHWQKPAPQFVLLIGDGTFDYMDYWQSGQTYPVPAYLLETLNPEMGETTSDHWFVNFDDDILPEMTIGRLPVRSVDELTATVNKIIAYETTGRISLPKRVLFSADIGDGFQDGAEHLARMLPTDCESVKLYLSQLEASAVKQGIISTTNQGVFMINHIGHGGVGLLSNQRILENSDINSFNNTDKYPIMLTLDCLTGYFIYPSSVGLESLSELLLRAPDKGIIAAIAPTGLSSPPEQLVFAQGFYESLFNGSCSTLGSAYYQAMESLFNKKSLIGNTAKVNNIIQTFNLLGDPALIIGSPITSGSSGKGISRGWRCGYLGIEVLILIGLFRLIMILRKKNRFS